MKKRGKGLSKPTAIQKKKIVIPSAVENEDPKEDVPVTNFEDHPAHQPVSRSILRRFWDNLTYVKYVILLLVLPPILNFAALQKESVALLPKGQKVDMGWGQKMFIHCEGVGLPTVILDAPTGASSDMWLFVQQELAKFTKVCVYDRSGIGSSDAIFGEVTSDDLKSSRRYIAQPSSLEQMTNDLHYLVTESKPLPRPFVLVGAEIGALVSRFYAISHTEDVSSIVLIDPLVETLFMESTEWKDYWYSKLLRTYESLHLSATLGLSRIALLLGWLKPFFFVNEVPEDVFNRQKSLLCNPRHIQSVLNEHLYVNTSFLQMRNAWLLDSFPKSVSVSVLSRKEPSEFPLELHKAWKTMQQHLVEDLHPGCHSSVLEETDFLNLYSQSNVIVSIIKNELEHWRKS